MSTRPTNESARPARRPAGVQKPAAGRRTAGNGTQRKAGYHGVRPVSPEEERAARLARAKAARIKKQKRKRIRKTLVLFGCLIIIACGVGYGIYRRMGNSFEVTNQLYDIDREFHNYLSGKEDLKADSFAQDLCVVTSDVPLETASLNGTQPGLLLDLDNKKVLFSQHAYQKVYPASITKIMTAILCLKYGNMDETVTIQPENLISEEGAQVCGFIAGDKLTMDQLLRCLLVYSGNDAASAIATTIAGTEADFVSMMNSYAQTLGCTGTHFVTPHGLQDEDHYTTPYDIYLMLREALNYPEFTEITQLPSYTVDYVRADGTVMSTFLPATDEYLIGEATPPKDVTILGGKTGYTSIAGNCLALLSQNAYGRPFVSIVMGAETKPVLYSQMNSLLQNIN